MVHRTHRNILTVDGTDHNCVGYVISTILLRLLLEDYSILNDRMLHRMLYLRRHLLRVGRDSDRLILQEWCKPTTIWQERLKIQDLIFVFVQCRIYLTASFAVGRVVSKQSNHQRVQKTTIFLSEKLEIVVKLVPLDLFLTILPGIHRINVLQSSS